MRHVDDGQLHALLDGELDSADPQGAEAIEAHLAACAACRARLAAQEELRDRIHGLLRRSGPRALVVPPFDELAGSRAEEGSRASRWALLTNPERLHAAAWAATFVLILGGTAALVVGLVLERVATEQRPGPGAVPVSDAPRVESVEVGPPFLQPRVPPRLADPSRVADAVRSVYPPGLRNAGIGGAVRVRALVSESGHVLASRLMTSSGFGALDTAALEVVGAIVFTPARNHDRPVRAWVELPIVFRAK